MSSEETKSEDWPAMRLVGRLLSQHRGELDYLWAFIVSVNAIIFYFKAIPKSVFWTWFFTGFDNFLTPLLCMICGVILGIWLYFFLPALRLRREGIEGSYIFKRFLLRSLLGIVMFCPIYWVYKNVEIWHGDLFMSNEFSFSWCMDFLFEFCIGVFVFLILQLFFNEVFPYQKDKFANLIKSLDKNN